jgi:hypothetical protein
VKQPICSAKIKGKEIIIEKAKKSIELVFNTIGKLLKREAE